MWGIVYYVCSGNDVGIYDDDDVYRGSKVTWRLLLAAAEVKRRLSQFSPSSCHAMTHFYAGA